MSGIMDFTQLGAMLSEKASGMGVKPEDVAARTNGVVGSHTTVRKLFKGQSNMSIENMLAICAVLGMDVKFHAEKRKIKEDNATA